ncbi:MAG: hypothetical protein AAFU54_22530 [Chloroflexota bacterium]
MENPARVRRNVLILFILIFIGSAAVTAALSRDYLQQRRATEQERVAASQEVARTVAQQADERFQLPMAIAHELAEELSAGELLFESAEMTQRLTGEIIRNRTVDGITVAFEPNIYPDTPPEYFGLYTEYVYRGVDNAIEVSNNPTYDYTLDPALTTAPTDWYFYPVREGARWAEPLRGEVTTKLLLEYGAPFTIPDSDDPGGVVSVGYLLQTVRDLIPVLHPSGYSFIISQEGNYLASTTPTVEVTSYFDENNARITQDAQAALNGETVEPLRITDPESGQSAWLLFEPIPSINGALGIVLLESELITTSVESLIQQTEIVGAGLLALYSLLLIVFQVQRGTKARLWFASIGYAVLALVFIVVVLVLAGSNDLATESTDTLVFNNDIDRSEFEDAVEAYIETTDQSAREYVQIPTGMEVHALDFPAPRSVSFNAYVWQRYPPGLLSEENPPQLALPQAVNTPTIDLVFHEQQGEEEVIIWYVNAQIKQPFDPLLFPFDRRLIEVHLAPVDLNRNLLFVPDFDSRQFNKSQARGISNDLELGDWSLNRTSYALEEVGSFNTNLGVSVRNEFNPLSELVFLMDLNRRNFFGPFIAYVLPGLVVALLMFGFMIRESEEDEVDEGDILAALGFGGSMFFVISVTHSALRERIGAIGITYLEYFYIALNVIIALVALNAFLYVKRPNLRFVQYKNNLVPRLLYWPLIMTLLMYATVMLFVVTR